MSEYMEESRIPEETEGEPKRITTFDMKDAVEVGSAHMHSLF